MVFRATIHLILLYKTCEAYCDNMGIIRHTPKPNRPIPEKKIQVDVMTVIKKYIQELNTNICMDTLMTSSIVINCHTYIN